MPKAMIRCPECGREVSAEAAYCPHCEADLLRDIAKGNITTESTTQFNARKGEGPQKKQTKSLVWLLILIPIVFMWYQASNSKSTNSESPSGANKMASAIIYSAKAEVSKLLKSPSTAIYGNSEILGNDAYGRYFVCVSVEAQNGFGGYRKYTFLVVVVDVDPETGKYSYYPYNSVYDVSDVPSCITKWKNGEVTSLVSSFLKRNHWSEAK